MPGDGRNTRGLRIVAVIHVIIMHTGKEECAKFEGTVEPPRGVEDPEAHESTGIFVQCSQPHGDAFAHAFGHHYCMTTENGRRDWYEQRMALSFATITTSEVVWLITYISKAIAYLRSDVWL